MLNFPLSLFVVVVQRGGQYAEVDKHTDVDDDDDETCMLTQV